LGLDCKWRLISLVASHLDNTTTLGAAPGRALRISRSTSTARMSDSPLELSYIAPGNSSSGGSWGGAALESPDRAAVEQLRQAVRAGGQVPPLSGAERQRAALARGRATVLANRERRAEEEAEARAWAAEQEAAGPTGYGPLRPRGEGENPYGSGPGVASRSAEAPGTFTPSSWEVASRSAEASGRVPSRGLPSIAEMDAAVVPLDFGPVVSNPGSGGLLLPTCCVCRELVLDDGVRCCRCGRPVHALLSRSPWTPLLWGLLPRGL